VAQQLTAVNETWANGPALFENKPVLSHCVLQGSWFSEQMSWTESQGTSFLYDFCSIFKLVISILKTLGPYGTLFNGTVRFKNVNSCWNTNIYSYLETSGGQSSNPYLNIVNFFNTRVD
jgi:hypothetical protein